MSPQQQKALGQLLMGASITEAAQAAAVTRQTVKERLTHYGAMYSPSMYTAVWIGLNDRESEDRLV